MVRAVGFRIDRGIPSDLTRVPATVARFERRGYDGCWTGEINHGPFLSVLRAFAVVALLPELAAALAHRCDGVIDRVLPAFPAGLSEDAVDGVLDELRHRR